MSARPPTAICPRRRCSACAEIGAWMSVNGEAIYGTRAIAPYREGQLAFTRKEDSVHALLLAEEGQSRPPAAIRLNTLRPAAGSAVYLLGHPTPLRWHDFGTHAEITLPEIESGEHAWTVKFHP